VRQLVVVDAVGDDDKVLVVEIEKNGAKSAMFVFDHLNAKRQSTVSTFQPALVRTTNISLVRITYTNFVCFYTFLDRQLFGCYVTLCLCDLVKWESNLAQR